VSLVERLRAGDPRALPRLVTLIEAGEEVGERALAELFATTGRAHIVGITGPPGAGKSTLVNALIGAYRGVDRTVGVVAIDPTSPLSGGAVLGDRIRMTGRHDDSGVFIRSMAARGRLGGLAAATASVVHLLDAAGFDVILVETVGAGQDGAEVAALAQTVLVLQVPGLGDDVQAIKAGLLEVGDLIVVNKADRSGADELVRQLRQALNSPAADGSWSVPVLRASAATGEGVEALREQIDAHRASLQESGELQDRVRAAASWEVLNRFRLDLERRLALTPEELPALGEAISAVADRRATPAAVVADLTARLEGR